MKGWALGRWWLGGLALLAFAAHAGDERSWEQVKRYFEKHRAFTAEVERIAAGLNAEWERQQALPDKTAAVDDADMAARWALREKEVARLEDLRQELIGILGDQAPAGFEPTSRLNFSDLLPAIRLPAFDGLLYQTAGKDATAVVVPRGLLEWDGKGPGRPRRWLDARVDDPIVHLGTSESAGLVAARLPVTVPAGANHARAWLLDTFDQGTDLGLTHVLVVRVDGDRGYYGSRLLQSTLPAPPACAKPYKRAVQRCEFHQCSEAAEARFLACTNKALKGRPELRQATQEAQAFLESLSPTAATR